MLLPHSAEVLAIEPCRPSAPEPLPAAAYITHVSGCPLYIWWAAGKRKDERGVPRGCWFIYIEYHRPDGRSAYAQLELLQAEARVGEVLSSLASISLDGIT